MKAGYCFPVVYLALLGLCCPGAQNPTPNRPLARSYRTFTSTAIPKLAAYEAFFAQVVAHERRAANPELSAETRELINQRLRLITQLEEPEFELVRQASHSVLAGLEELGREVAAVAQEASLGPNPRSVKFAALQSRRERLISAAIEQLREGLGEARFEELDQRIREHVSKTLRVYDLKPVVPAGN